MLFILLIRCICESFARASLYSKFTLVATLSAVFSHVYHIYLEKTSTEPLSNAWFFHWGSPLLIYYYQSVALYELSIKPRVQEPRAPFDDFTTAHSRLIMYHHAFLICAYGSFANLRDAIPLAVRLFGEQATEMLNGSWKTQIRWVALVFIGASVVFIYTVLTTVAMLRFQQEWNDVVTRAILEVRQDAPTVPRYKVGVSKLRTADKKVLGERWGR